MLFKYSFMILLFIGMSICGVTSFKQVATTVHKTPIGEKKPNTVTAALSFDKDVKPIFEKHCNPCHFPGGKLYDRLPFDRASTIIKNETGILRRISDTGEVKLIRQFVEENIAGNSGTANQ